MATYQIDYASIAAKRWHASPESGCTYSDLSEGAQKILRDQVREESDARFRVSREPCDSHL